MKPVYTLLVLLLIVVVAVGMFLDFSSFRKKVEEAEAEPEQEDSTNTTIMGNDNFPLKVGSRGLRVTKLQKNLNIIYKKSIAEDGKFGTDTLSLVRLIGRDDVPENVFILLNNTAIVSINNNRPKL